MTDGMPRPRIPHLRHEKSRHDKWCWYFRKGDGPRIRIPGAYESPEFMAAYNAALNGQPIPKAADPRGGTIAWLADKYMNSGEYAQLAESSQYFRSTLLKQMVKPIGHVQFSRIGRKEIQDAMDRRSKTPFAANNLLSAISMMFAYAVTNDWVKANPCDGVKPYRTKSTGHHTWTVEQVEQYRAHHKVGTRARLALDLLLFTGLRRSDIIVVGRQHVRENLLTLRTLKTGTVVYIPIFPELRESIDATKTGDLAFLTAKGSRPFTSGGGFGARFRIWCQEAGLPEGCTAHGVRKAGATIAANSGASARELMAMYGWTRISMAEAYTRAADQAKLARSAAERIANSFLPHPEKGAADNAGKESKNNG